MRSGRLRHRMWLKEPTHTPDGKGANTTTWGTVEVFWGSVEPLRGREWIASGLENSEVSGKIVRRYKSGITPDMIVTFDSRTFEIVSVINVEERNIEQELMVVEKVII